MCIFSGDRHSRSIVKKIRPVLKFRLIHQFRRDNKYYVRPLIRNIKFKTLLYLEWKYILSRQLKCSETRKYVFIILLFWNVASCNRLCLPCGVCCPVEYSLLIKSWNRLLIPFLAHLKVTQHLDVYSKSNTWLNTFYSIRMH